MLNPVSDSVLAELRAALPPEAVRPVSPAYLEEPRGKWRGEAAVVLAPATVGEVARAIEVAARHRVGVVPYGGGTGLVGGQVLSSGPAPILLSLERMGRVRAMLPGENAMVVEAGAILSEVQAAAEAAGRLFPLSLASEGSARIGGLLATNAGGLNVLRYGTARELVLGLEAVLPSGEIWNGLRRLRKDNTGYDLRHLLIGAEGTLGVITAAALRLFPRPAHRATALVVVRDPAAALALLEIAQTEAEGFLSAFELLSGVGFHFMRETGLEHRLPWGEVPEWLVLLELGTPAAVDPQLLVESIFTAAAEAGHAEDGAVASSEAQRQAFWAIREAIPEANRRIGAVASHDMALPLGAIPDFLEAAGAAIAAIGPLRVNAFGHLGDGNLHYNVFPPAGEARSRWASLAEPATRALHDLVHAHEGTFSAEHGVGRAKVGDLERYGDPAKLGAMRAIKAALDPLGIMNPGAVLRAT